MRLILLCFISLALWSVSYARYSQCRFDSHCSRPKDKCLLTRCGYWRCRKCFATCGRNLPTITNGVVTGSTLIGKTVTVTCNSGYEPVGDSTVVCLGSGSYSGAIGCQSVACGATPLTTTTPNSQSITLAVSGANTFQSVAVVVCNTGYTPADAELSCLASGNWETTTCNKVDCGNVLPTFQFGTAALPGGGTTLFGDTADVTCDSGYSAADTTIECQASGEWQCPECSPVSCGDIPLTTTIPNSQSITLVVSGVNTYQSVAIVVCNTGYTPANAELSCLADGNWETTTCNKVDCGNVLPTFQFGTAALPGAGTTLFGDTADVTCDSGYSAADTTIECQASGDWECPECSPVSCGDTPLTTRTPNSQSITLAVSGANTFQSVAVVVCDTGYTPADAELSCLASGNWETTTCNKVDCGNVLPTFQFGTAALPGAGTTLFGDTADVTCDSGYSAADTTIECQASGEWQCPECSPVLCGATPLTTTTPNSQSITLAVSGANTFQSVAVVVCNTGYTPADAEVSCLASGNWETTTCNKVDCGNVLPTFHFGTGALPGAGTTLFGDTADVTCDSGYSAADTTIECQASGDWECPECSPVSCGDTPLTTTIPNSQSITLVVSGANTFQSVAIVVCNTGYTPANAELSCLASGSWETTTCNKVDCGNVLPTFQFGTAALPGAGTTLFGDTADVTCDSGYSAADTTIECQASGEWQCPECSPVSCGATPLTTTTPNSQSITLAVSGANTFQSVAVVVCDTGYTPVDAELSCLASGNWETTTCNKVDCGNVLPTFQFGTAALSGAGTTLFGDTVDVTCDSGYSAADTTIECQASGEWQCPECSPVSCGDTPLTTTTPNSQSITLAVSGANTFQSVAVVVCNTGYTPADAELSCLASGNWETTTCNKVDCGSVLPTFQFGTAALPGGGTTLFGDTADVTCDSGYSAADTTIECQASGEWQCPECSPVSCGDTPLTTTTPNSQSITLAVSGANTFQSVAVVVCNTGYTPADAELSCLASGNWETTTCNKVDCGSVLPTFQFGTAALPGGGTTLFGDTADVTCDSGYSAADTTIECQASGEWQCPECSPVSCGATPSTTTTPNSQSITLAVSGANTFQSVAVVVCDTGYTPADAELSCLASGNWETTTCNKVDCGNVLPTFQFGTAALPGAGTTLFGDTADVTCDSGNSAADTTIECQTSGEWQCPECSPVSCGATPSTTTTPNSQSITLAVSGANTFQSVAVVVCNTGYTPADAELSCLASGNWETTTCNKVDCGNVLPTFQFGTASLPGAGTTLFGDTADVTCDSGYSAADTTIECQAGGEWQCPECSPVSCGDTPLTTTLPNSQSITLVVSGANTFQSVAVVVCNTGYTPANAELSCLASGSWETTTCNKVDCGNVLPTFQFGTAALPGAGTTLFGDTADVTCDSGYSAADTTIECQASGEWQCPECSPVSCGATPLTTTTPNSQSITLAVSGANTFQSVAVVVCETGYTPADAELSCLASGNWETTTCNKVDCGNVLPTFQFGTAALPGAGTTLFGDTADVTCDSGYSTADATIECQASGEWQCPECSPVSCGATPLTTTTPNSQSITLAVAGANTFQSVAVVVCDTGYTPADAELSCLADGNWETTTCNKVDCSHVLPTFQFGSAAKIGGGTSFFGDTATVSCFPGYETADTTIECQASGEWECPECTPVSCGATPLTTTIPNFQSITLAVSGANTYQSVAVVVCDTGYTPADAELSCLDDGNWETTTCDRVSCGALPTIPNGNVVSASTLFGDEGTITCNSGFEIADTTISCQASGVWESAFCSRLDCGAPTVAGASVEFGLTVYESIAFATCSGGLTGGGTIECMDTGDWTDVTCSGVVTCTDACCAGKSYFIGPASSVTFPEYVDYCADISMNTLSIQNTCEQTFLAGFVSTDVQYYWSGANDQIAEQTFVFERDGSTVTSLPFVTGANDVATQGAQDCLAVDSMDGLNYEDLVCATDTAGVICENP